MLKIAKVIPIFKGENPTDPNNYRPIPLLSIFDKLLEKVMYNRVNAFLTKHKIFYKYQFGFIKSHAIADALSEVIDFIYKFLDEGNFVFGIYIDLKKAFDTVQHRTLLYTSTLRNSRTSPSVVRILLIKEKRVCCNY